MLHYGLNKNHPYVDGNKRLAVTAMEAFLWMNRVHLLATDDELEQFALDVAADRLSRDRSVDFVVRRAFRWEWSDAQIERRLRAFDRAELGSVLGSGKRVARFDEAIRARVRSLREQLAPYLAS